MKVLLNIDQSDRTMLQTYMTRYLQGHKVKGTLEVLTPDRLKDMNEDFDVVICAKKETCKELTGDSSLDHWRGGRYNEEGQVPVLFVSPLKHYFKIAYGGWLHRMDCRKIESIKEPDEPLHWESTNNPYEVHKFFADRSAKLMSLDIETTKQNHISCIGYTIWFVSGYRTLVVYGLDNPDMLDALRGCHELNDIPVVTHNGCFDMFHLLRYRMPIKNWYFDTEYFWNAWQAELPKKLSFLASVFLYDYKYWKDGVHSRGKDLHLYNAKDNQNTLRILLEMLKVAPDWAVDQYIKKFQRTIPILYTMFEGFKVDLERLGELSKIAREAVDEHEAECRKYMGDINLNSPKQLQPVLYDKLGAKQVDKTRSTDETHLIKISQQSEILAKACGALANYRKARLALTTFFEAELVGNGRLLYSLNVDGTKTDRMSCRQSSLYADDGKNNKGAQLQNIPGYMKSALVADDGWTLINPDYGQADAYGTAYLSQDERMINALQNPRSLFPSDYEPVADEARDFYCCIIASVFGRYIKKSKEGSDYYLRQFQKKVMHGRGYLMGPNTLIESAIKELGYTFILDCMKILEFKGTQKGFITEVMKRLNRMFPGTEPWWRKVQFDLKLSGGELETPDGWVRIFHGDTDSHKMLREAVAHQPQHLTVVGINRAFCNMYYKHRDKFRLKGQVHDSIVGQCRDEDVEECVKILYDELHQPIVIHGREMWLPVEISVGKDWSNMREVKI